MNSSVYRARRAALRKAVGRGPILIHGLDPAPRNYRDNIYPYRQGSHFLYYTGLAQPGLSLLMLDHRELLFAARATMDDIVWSGATPSPEELAKQAGLDGAKAPGQMPDVIAHTLPSFRGAPNGTPSEKLVDAIAAQRSIKTPAELDEIESAIAISDAMHRAAMSMARPGATEGEVARRLSSFALTQAYPPIVTVRGEILHNQAYTNPLQRGQLLLVDAGAEAASGYASDITRVTPVGGRFSTMQRDIYEVVLRAQLEAIAMIRPGIPYRDVHLFAACVIAQGLIDVGLMKGDAADAVAAGAHALFFPHGLGHMLGLDVHDMEDLGDVVGYPRSEKRSAQFGLCFLRLAKRLETGFVLTVEPGIYFIPALIGQWRSEKRHADFINYAKLARYRTFGGIRIEDEIVVTKNGARVLGPAIPKTVREVERCAS